MKHLALLCIRFYRKFLSPLKPTCCRMTPSCSAYAYEAFLDRGFFVGSFLSLWRILRCNPFGRAGYDPVPHGVHFKRIDLIRKKMGMNVRPLDGKGVPAVVTVEKKKKRKVASLLPYGGCGYKK